MKKYVLLTAMVLALAVPCMAWSQSAPGGGNGAPPSSSGAGGSGGGQEREQKFQEHKTEILQRMNEHLAEVQKRIACVQAATNHEALRACMPERREGEGQRGEGHGPMGQGQGHPQ
jgi:TolA-binding protein